jgi:hypothetical protein
MYFRFELARDPSSGFRDAAAYYFGGRFARSWFWANEEWLKAGTPEMFDVIKHEIESTPVQTEFGYLNRIRSGI